MTTNNFYVQKLKLKDTSPVYIKNYRIPHSQKSEIDQQVAKLLKNDFIEPSSSEYNSPIILVPKPALNSVKRWRMCLDYRQVNKRLVADKFPLPRMDEILDSLGNAKCFSVLDLFQGFHQVPLDPDSRDLTSFSTSKGSYRWKVLPFGLNVSPNSFARMMSIAFAGIPADRAFLYLDDIIVIGRSDKHHLQNLRRVFETLREKNLKIHPYKCRFFEPQVTFLGHLCTPNGILPDPRKIEAVKKYPTPTNKEESHRFVSFANYYRKFIKNFSLIAKPLNNLNKKSSEFVWSEDCEKSFLTLKEKLMNPPILAYPDFTKSFIVTVDASKVGCGAVLSQINEDGHDLPVSFASKTWSKADSVKSTPVQECMAIHFALTQFRPYVYGVKFLVRTDHRSLIYLFTHKNLSPKLMRVRLELEEFDFEIVHISGSKNVVADALSRITMSDLIELYGTTKSVLAITRSKSREMNSKIDRMNDSGSDEIDVNVNEMLPCFVPVTEQTSARRNKKIPQMICRVTKKKQTSNGSDDVIQMNVFQKSKKLFSIVVSNVKNNASPALLEAMIKLQELTNKYNILHLQWSMNDVLFKIMGKEKVVTICKNVFNKLHIILLRQPISIVNENERMKLLTEFHNSPMFGGHCGQKKLLHNLQAKYYWPRMRKDVAKFVKECSKCKLTKVTVKNKEPMVITSTPLRPFDVVVIDTIGPLPVSRQGNRYAVTMVCDLSKYLVIVPIPDKKAPTVAKAILKHFILIYGLMRRILTDLGTEYVNSVLQDLCSLLEVSHAKSTAYHHQTVGTAERSHRTFNEYVRAYISDRMEDWEEYSHYFAFCYNISHNAAYSYKYTPHELVFGKKPTLPFEWLDGRVDPLYNVDDFVSEAKYRLQRAHVDARQLIQKMKLRNKSYYDRNADPIDLNVGSKVKLVVLPYDKHSEIYKGPYVVKMIDDPNVMITGCGKEKIVHKDRLRKYE